MSEQYAIDFSQSPYRDGMPGHYPSPNSRAAAEKIAGKAPSKEKRCYEAVVAAGEHGMTADEAADLLGMNIITARARFCNLSKPTKKRPALIKERGEKDTRPSKYGNDQAVYVKI